jgi:flagellar motor switch protein FliN/FliY
MTMRISQAHIAPSFVDAERVTAAGVGAVPPAARTPDVSRILGLEVKVAVVLAERLITIESILDMTAGTIIEFEVPFDADLHLKVGNRTIGHGQTVKIGENFGLRLTDVADVPKRVDALGG